MAGAFDNRHTNFIQALEYYSSLVDVSSVTGISANYLSQLKGGKRIGHVMARRLEQGMGLQSGWLDLDHSENTTITLSEHELGHQALKLPLDAKLRLIQKLAASLVVQRHAKAENGRKIETT